jgi:hypothetical protein
VYDSLDPALHERLLANAAVLFDIELAPFVAYEPTAEDLAQVRVRRAVTAGAANRDPTRYDLNLWIGGSFGARRTFLVEPETSSAGAATPVRKERRC